VAGWAKSTVSNSGLLPDLLPHVTVIQQAVDTYRWTKEFYSFSPRMRQQKLMSTFAGPVQDASNFISRGDEPVPDEDARAAARASLV